MAEHGTAGLGRQLPCRLLAPLGRTAGDHHGRPGSREGTGYRKPEAR
jgi:hypothetical protein